MTKRNFHNDDLNFDLESKLQELETTLESPLPLNVIQGRQEALVDVGDVGVVGINHVNHHPDPSQLLETDKFQGIIFIGCKISQINIYLKTLKLIFLDCHGCHINVNNNVLGAIEIIRCSGIRMSVNSESPLVQVDLSSDVRINQTAEEVIYVATSCIDIKCYSRTLGKMFAVPCTMFREQFICLLNAEGFNHVVRNVALNSVEHNVMIK